MEKENSKHTPEDSSEALHSFYPVGFHRLIRELQKGRGEFEELHTICLAWAKSVLEIKEEERPLNIAHLKESSSDSKG